MKATRFIIPVILLAAACQQMETDAPDSKDITEIETETTEAFYTLSIQASKGDAQTKALDLVSGTPDYLDAYWKNTEKVRVYKDGSLLGTLDVVPDAGEKPTMATLTGPINTDGLAANDELTLIIPRENWDYTSQVGTLASIETTYDYATASVTIATVDEVNHTITTTGYASFTNEQSIYRFGFKVGGEYIDPKNFIVSASRGKLVQCINWNGSAWASSFGSLSITPASAAGDHFYYSAIRNESTEEDSYSFIVTGSDDALYLGNKTIPASVLDAPGKFISAKSITISKPNFAPASGTTENAL